MVKMGSLKAGSHICLSSFLIALNLSHRSNIVFKTAGVLLDEMREKGLNALKYKVIILDEVHERSVESDLVLVCVKQFLLKNNDLRLISSFLKTSHLNSVIFFFLHFLSILLDVCLIHLVTILMTSIFMKIK